MADETSNTATATAPPDEGLLHSLATSVGIDPEAVKSTAKAIWDNPVEAAKTIGGAQLDEFKEAATHPMKAAKLALHGVVSSITNPEAQAVAKERLNSPGLANKLVGAEEYLTSGIPLVGGNFAKAEEQGAQGNLPGALGTIAGTVAPMVTGAVEELPESIHEAGAQARENMASRQSARIEEAKTGKVLTVEPESPAAKSQAALPAAPETATENTVPDHIEFNKFGGKEVQAPYPQAISPEIKAEGPEWDRTHSAIADGKKVGSVGYKLDPEGQAQIYGAVVEPSLRGHGIAQKIYRSVIDEARKAGASSITSDSTNVSTDAARVWEALRDKGLPVENITHPNGKPGYQIDFENPPISLPEFRDAVKNSYDTLHQSPESAVRRAVEDYKTKGIEIPKEWYKYEQEVDPKFRQVLARRGQMPGQTVNLSSAYGETGGYVGGHLEYRPRPGSAGEAIAHQRAIERAGTTTGTALMDIPAERMPEGSTTHDVVTHELAHGVVADMMGLSTEGSEVQSHLHPTASSGGAAAITLDYSKLPGTTVVPGRPGVVRFTDEGLKNAWPKFLPTYLAGGVAQELVHGIPFAENTGLAGDMGQLRSIGEMMGFTPEETQGMIAGSLVQTREMLNHPATLDILKKSASEREEGLSKTLHVSANKVQDVIRQVKEARNEGKSKATGAESSGIVSETQPREAGTSTEGDVRKDDRQAVSSSLEARKVKTPSPDKEEPEHPTVTALKTKYGSSTDPADMTKGGASFLHSDGTVTNLGTLDHPAAIASAEGRGTAGGGTVDRTEFINNTGSIRVRHRPSAKAGPEIVFSVPEKGVTPEQADMMKQAVGKMGRNGNLLIESARAGEAPSETVRSWPDNKVKEFAKPSDVEPMLREMGAHPEQKVSPKAEVSTNAETAPNTKLQASAQKYAKAKGMPEINHEPVEVDPARAKEIAKMYDEAEHNPDDPKVKAAYDALKAETKDQFHHLRDDLGLKFEPQEKDPYKSAGEMMNDVKQNNRLKVFTGSSTGADHPLSEIDPETGHSYNTLFRWVHDAMGHAAGGNDFSEGGEKSATEAHAQMYSDAARPAMRAETEGQTSWFFHNPEVESGTAKPGKFAEQKATILPDVSADWHKAAGESAAQNEAGGINPRTGKSDSKGFGTEIMPELRQPLDHAPTTEDFKNFYEQHKDIFDKHPELRVGWDNKSAVEGGHEINVGAVGPDASRVAKKLDQKSAFNITKGEVVPTGGTGLRTSFPNYPIEDRIKDLTNQKQSDISGFEHVSKDVYDHLEPDERDYIKGDKNLQRNMMAQYHKIAPSVPETTNAMQAGAALGGWWQRYIDVFHNLTDGGEAAAKQIGPSHAEILKQWHAALSANKSVGDANNIAWHSYADWLDAGKPTDRKSINDIILKNGAQPEGSGKKGNAAISDTLGRKGKIVHEGIDTSKIFNLVNSPEMRGERSFSGDVFRDDAKNPLMGKGEGYRKVPSMGATVAGKGNLNRLVIDTHIADFYGQDVKGTAARYIADSAHLRQAAKALGLKGGEGQEQLWGTVLGLKTLLKQGLTPAEASGKLNADVINNIGKDYAEIIANDPEITRPGGILDRLKDKYGIGRGSAGVGAANIQTPSTSASEGGPAGSQAGVDPSLLGETAGRIRGTISESKIKKPAAEPEDEDTSFTFGANVKSTKPSARPAGKVKGKVNAVDLLRMLGGLKNPGKP